MNYEYNISYCLSCKKKRHSFIKNVVDIVLRNVIRKKYSIIKMQVLVIKWVMLM